MFYTSPKAEGLLLELEKSKLITSIQSKLYFSTKIDNLISKTTSFYDKRVTLEYYVSNLPSRDPIEIVKFAARKIIHDFNWVSNIKKAAIVIRENDGIVYMYFFYGEEQTAFHNILSKMAAKTKWVPQIIEGTIVGEIDEIIIMRVTLEFSVDYGMYLKKLYDAGKVNGIINPR